MRSLTKLFEGTATDLREILVFLMQQMVFPDFTAIIAVSRAEYEGRWRKIILENRQNFLKSLKTNPIPSQFPFKFSIGIKPLGFSS
jgi:hypothetical protein